MCITWLQSRVHPDRLGPTAASPDPLAVSMRHAVKLHLYFYFQRFLVLMVGRVPHGVPRARTQYQAANIKPNLHSNVPKLHHLGHQLG